MIAKEVKMRSIGQSDFGGLVGYITSTHGNSERLGRIEMSNCQAKDIQAATSEILATQALNKRAKSDKTCHLILSFKDGENPSKFTLKEIEEKVCSDLGYRGHQRISATHYDTGNVHIHIAINKIHPQKLIIVDPHKSYHKLSHICEKIEKEYGLQRDNHATQKRAAECRVADIEHQSGIESLVSWVRKNCLSEIESAGTWEILHRVLSEHGLEIKARGRGLVIRSQDGTVCKASTVSRDISKQKLEAKLGPFENKKGSVAATRNYEKKPIGFANDTSKLYEQYCNEMDQLSSAKKDLLRTNTLNCDDAYRAIVRRKRLLIAALKLSSAPAFSKRILYKRIYASSAKKLDALKKKRGQRRREILNSHRKCSWVDWLKREAEKGKVEATKALRSRSKYYRRYSNCIVGENKDDFIQPGFVQITKRGKVEYRNGKASLFDEGDCLLFKGDPSNSEIKSALMLARQRFGNVLDVRGSHPFRHTVSFVAARASMPIKFKDHKMEQSRVSILFEFKLQTAGNRCFPKEATPPPPDARHRLRTIDQVTERSISTLGANNERRTYRSEDARRGTRRVSGAWDGGSGGGTGGRTIEKAQSDTIFNPSNRDSERDGDLHDVSILGMVQNRQRPEVLLQSALHGHMGQVDQSTDNDVRRSFHGNLNEQNARAAHKYIKERTEKRESGISVFPHSLLGGEKGDFVHKGIRVVDGVSLLLLERNGRVYVKPINPSFEDRIKRWKIGDEITVSDSIKKKGVRRKR